ncbi:MAG: choline/ethanolamine kinase family protein [Parachlamydiaceae bacterium]|nr:choline/ethanolamine kinase family protein [Parachlamydiaceae bacterium]
MKKNKILLAVWFFVLLFFNEVCGDYNGYLNEFFKNPKEPLIVTTLHGGLSQSQNYKIIADGKSYVLRIFDEATALDERQQEINSAVCAGQQGIGPRIVYIDDYFRAMIMDFVEGQTLTRSVLEDKNILRIFLQSLRQLHFTANHFPTGLTVFDKIRLKIEKINQNGIAAPVNSINNALMKLGEIEKILRQYPLVFCHNDLNALNIIVNGKTVKFIDWTESGMDSPYSDLGFFVLVNLIEEERYNEVLESYFGYISSAQEMYLLKLMRKVSTLRIFASFFSDHEPAILDTNQRIQRSLELEKFLSNDCLLPLNYFIDLHIKGQLTDQKMVIMASLSALREFLQDDL